MKKLLALLLLFGIVGCNNKEDAKQEALAKCVEMNEKIWDDTTARTEEGHRLGLTQPILNADGTSKWDEYKEKKEEHLKELDKECFDSIYN
jgi:uncharacterized lipoprotein NlpE involved in copper resistance